MARQNKTIAKMKSEYMNQYQAQMERHRRRRRRFIRRFTFCSLVIVITFLFMFSYHMKQRALYAEKKAEFDALTEQLVKLELKEKELLEEIDLLNDEEYILDIARSTYFLSKNGELIFQVHDEHDRSY